MTQSDLPLVQTILRYVSEQRLRLHMPGHKGGRWRGQLIEELLGQKTFAADLTELPGLDDLHNPQGVIAQAEKLAADLFGAAASFFLVNGASAGIAASILAFGSPHSRVIVPRGVHRSVLHGLILSGARPIYVPARYGFAQLPLPLQSKDLQNAVAKYPDCRVVCMVSPTYEGIAVDLSQITRVVQGHKLQLIVDEAHGAHFYFHSSLPVPALKYGADAVVHGTHKTLGSLTQTGMLHVSNLSDVSRIRNALSLLQSTSPSYVLLASLDAARQQAALQGRQELEQLLELCGRARREINQIRGFYCPDAEILKDEQELAFDATKLLIGCCGTLNGHQLAAILHQDYKVDVEMAQESYVLAMLTLGDDEPVLESLVAALRDISVRFALAGDYSELEGKRKELPPLPELILSPREAFFSPQREIPISEAAGKISGETIASYPPGIPLICLGERFEPFILETIQDLKKQDVHWQGPSDPTLRTVKILDI
ncbi:aminotransferase class I/II-fold pyridoxal phosphate-dependent enzyme [Zhaonella formicivorans]|uniref:aminotransferase class I/II-fold pyridoxal phosphate-dependent enzyme n=1 Tax=Zhaonella formicivorans TaxID=2528593 RepID=UPI001D11F1F7|nr:aminotransferase class I/II-fold pyridoxal phosphate-dependent enzyme [Zhaonella formicivorans]